MKNPHHHWVYWQHTAFAEDNEIKFYKFIEPNKNYKEVLVTCGDCIAAGGAGGASHRGDGSRDPSHGASDVAVEPDGQGEGCHGRKQSISEDLFDFWISVAANKLIYELYSE